MREAGTRTRRSVFLQIFIFAAVVSVNAAQPVTLTMKSYPSSLGWTAPEVGEHQYNKGDSLEITAVTDLQVVFSHWSGSENVEFDDSRMITTTAKLNGDGKITAVFKAIPSRLCKIDKSANFGRSVARSGDEIFIGKPDQISSKVFVYDDEDGAISQKQEISKMFSSGFGGGLAISGDTLGIVEYSPCMKSRMLIYAKENGEWEEAKTFSDYIDHVGVAVKDDNHVAYLAKNNCELVEKKDGEWVTAQQIEGAFNSIAYQGDFLFLGEHSFEEYAGVVNVYSYYNGAWSEYQELTMPATGDIHFGTVISANGNWLAVASQNDKRGREVHLYELYGGVWEYNQTLSSEEEEFGLSLSFNEKFLLIGCKDEHALMYAENNHDWVLFQQIPLDGQDSLAVAMIEGDGADFVIGDFHHETATMSVKTFYDKLTMSVSGKGTTDPATGVHTMLPKRVFPIKATPASDYHFEKWIPEGAVHIHDPTAPKTGAVLYGEAEITAVFKPSVTKVTLTMAATPKDGGSTDPAVGEREVNEGESLSIQATASEGWFFTHWLVSGGGVISDPHDPTTSVSLSSDARVTAKFKKTQTVKLTMAADPADSGTTTPDPGEYEVNSGDVFEISAIPGVGYHFVNWNASGGADLVDPHNPDTAVKVKSDAVVTAHFAVDAETATLTMSASPEGSGHTIPAEGEVTKPVGETFAISAVPDQGYHFHHWLADGPVEVDNLKAMSTTARIEGDAELTAFFVPNTTTATLTLAVDPADGGTTNPGAGAHTVNVGELVEITAFAEEGNHFTSWQVEGEATISDPDLISTTVTLKDSATVTARFAPDTTDATLTMAVSPDGGGSTDPGAGTHTVHIGEPTRIEALPADGHHFLHWQGGLNADIANPNRINTSATFSGDATVTAVFAANQETADLTMGSSPDDGGSTTPGTGAHEVYIGESLAIEAMAATGYHFVNWSGGDNVTIADVNRIATTAMLSGDADIVANFERNDKPATMTMAVSGSGSTNPGVGSHSVNTGESLLISAQAADGYHFTNWSATSDAAIANDRGLSTTVILNGDATVTANFTANTTQATLTMAVNDASEGVVDPPAGARAVNVGEAFEINAVANAGYEFVNWTAAANAHVADLVNPSTSAYLDGDATITANFSKIQVSLEMAATPSAGGTTTPAAGSRSVTAGEAQAITATAASGYHFTGWSVVGEGEIANPKLLATSVTAYGDVIVTARFAANTQQVTLTTAVTPVASGGVSPTTGAVNAGEPIAIEATAASGYHFTGWSSEGKADIANPKAFKTTVVLVADATVTARFAANATTVKLTMATAPASSGTTDPSVGEHSVNADESITITAIDGADDHFTHWTLSGDAVVANSKAFTTTVVLTGDAAVTANFAKNYEMSELTMAVAPQDGGDTNPGVGDYDVHRDVYNEIEATAGEGFHFTHWSVSGEGSARIVDFNSPKTMVMVTDGDVTVTANFKANTTPVSLTMAASPSDSGSTDPGLGSHSVNAEEPIPITAVPADGYHFTNWTSTGAATLSDPSLVETVVTLTGDATVTANFAPDATKVQLTMGVAPDGGGTVNPGAGAHTVNVGESIAIEASPGAGYYFQRWKATGAAVIADPRDPTSTVTLTGDAEIRAEFDPVSHETTIDFAVSPEDGGSTDPTVGARTVNVGETIKISSRANAGFHFVRWSVSGEVTIGDPNLMATFIVANGEGSVSANFEADATTATLTIAVTPDASGTTNPGTGTYEVDCGAPVEIKAFPADAHQFKGWTILGSGEIDAPANPDTFVTLSGDATVTAVFISDKGETTLTMSVSPDGGGETNPGAGSHQVSVGQPFIVSANAADDYHFTGWTVAGQGRVDNPAKWSTIATLDGDATITANFSPNQETATLIMVVSPENTGETKPAIGVNEVNVGEPVEIEAVAEAGYYFVNWTVSGSVKIGDPDQKETIVTLNGDAYVMANFAVQKEEAVLTLAVSPDNAGSTNPGAGEMNVSVGEPVKIEAIPADNHHFVKWEVSEHATIGGVYQAETVLILSGDGSATATFEEDSTAVTLTIAVSPEASGTTNPGAGDHETQINEPVSVEASPADGYYFTQWTGTENVTIHDEKHAKTTVALSGDGELTAVFATRSAEISVSVLPSPQGKGYVSTNPSGPKFQKNEPIVLKATPADGYFFNQWKIVSGKGAVSDVNSADTLASFEDDSVLEAVFADKSVTLTIDALPVGGGACEPAAGEHHVEALTSVAVSAVPSLGYAFVNWTGTDDVAIADRFQSDTTVEMSGDGSLTANFAKLGGQAILTVKKTSVNAGTVSPDGRAVVSTGDEVLLEAVAVEGFSFSRWVGGNRLRIIDSSAASTQAVVLGDSVVYAVFTSDDVSVGVTFSSSPEGGGMINQGETITTQLGELVNVTATPADGYEFLNWSGRGQLKIDENYQESTFLIPLSDCQVTANFALTEDVFNVQLGVDDGGGGTVEPLGNHNVKAGEAKTILAEAYGGYAFFKWNVISGAVAIDNEYAQNASIVPVSDAVIEAEFVKETTSDNVKIKVAINKARLNGDAISVRNAPMEKGVDPSLVDMVVNVDGHTQAITQDTFNWKEREGKYTFTAKNRRGKLVMDTVAGTWSFTANQQDINTIDGEDGVTVMLSVNEVEYGADYPLDETNNWTFDSERQKSEDYTTSGAPLPIFDVVKAKGGYNTFRHKSSLAIINASVALPEEFVFDPETHVVTVGVNAFSYVIPAGSMVSKREGVYIHKDASKYYFKLDLNKGKWVFKTPLSTLDNQVSPNDGVLVVLTIGSYQGGKMLYPSRKARLATPPQPEANE